MGKITEEDIGKVDHHRAAHRIQGQNRQRLNDRICIVLLNSLFQLFTAGFEVDVASDELNAIANPLENQDPFIVRCDRSAGLSQALGDRDRGQKWLVELVRLDLGIEVVILLVKGEQAVVFCRIFGEFREIAKLLWATRHGRHRRTTAAR